MPLTFAFVIETFGWWRVYDDTFARMPFSSASIGLSVAELAQARHGLAADHKGTEALSFARKLVDQRGRVTDADVDHVRRAGYSDGEINEIVANVALSIFTNYFNHGAETEIDFPTAPNP